MPRNFNHSVTPTVLHRTGQAFAGGVAVDAALATLSEIARVLTPIIGQRGVIALYQRSLFLCASRHKCLSELGGSMEKPDSGLHLDALHAALVPHSLDTVALCSNDLLSTLNQLLISLIGVSLAERLLRGVWRNALCGRPPQSTPLPLEAGR